MFKTRSFDMRGRRAESAELTLRPTRNCRLPTANRRLPAVHRLLPAACCLLPAVIVLAQAPPDRQAARPEQPQQPIPPVTFKVEINYVEVDARVVDAQGTFIRDLRKEEFQVLEDGKPQAVTTFALVDIPVERADKPLFASRPIEPDVTSNQREFDGRLYVIVLDDTHTNALRTQRVKVAARQFIERSMGANDRAAVLHASGRSDISQDFTDNRRLLLASVDKFMGRKLPSVTLEKLEEYQRTRDRRAPGDRINDPRDFERGFDARNTLETLRNVAEWMAGIRGRRKALIYISEGIDYDIHDVFNNRYASTIIDEARDTIAAATRSNVSIYAVDPRGLTGMGDEVIEIAGLPDDTTLNLGPTSLQNELRLAQDSLRVLADETGGFAALNSNDFRQAFDRIVRENSSYYVLGYYPSNDRRDGRFRKIQVRVTRPGLQVSARKGYAAPRGRANARVAEASAGTTAEVREALNSPLPITGLTLTAFAAAFKGAAPNASVALAIEAAGRRLTFKESEGKFTNDLEVSIVAIDQQGKAHPGERNTLNMTLKPDTHARVMASGFRVLSRLNLPPGRYQLRVAARETGAGAVGSVHYDLEVPDFSKAAISMSGLVLTSAAARAVPTARPDEQFKDVLPGPPTTAREFARDDELALFVEVYDNEGAKPHRVDITSTLKTDEGRTIFTNEEERSSAELQGARGGYGYSARIPLRDLAPGLYVLKVEARSRLGEGATGAREVQFRVRP